MSKYQLMDKSTPETHEGHNLVRSRQTEELLLNPDANAADKAGDIKQVESQTAATSPQYLTYSVSCPVNVSDGADMRRRLEEGENLRQQK
ncbi:uncharacterized protein V6R79_008616 [Siganus canaliculatus]